MSSRTAAGPSYEDARGPWAAEIVDVVRGASGGLLFGVPLLYTMEVWWLGSHTSPAQMVGVIGLLVVPVFALNQTAGFRTSRDVRMRDAVADTVEAVAIGIVVTTVVLVLLREITPDVPLGVALGKVLYESVPFCLGIGLARHFLQGGRDAGDDDGGEEGQRPRPKNATLADLGATTLGATFISLSIAPTDEVPMLASAMDPAWLLLVLAASLVTSYAIVFVAGFADQEGRHAQGGVAQRPFTETVVSYLVALTVAALLLWFFQRGVSPSSDLLARAVILGFPAAVGGAAGRLAV